MIPARLKLYLLRRSLATAERDRHAIACRAAEEISARDNHIHRLRRKLSATEAQHLIARHIDNSGSLDHLAHQLDAARAQVLA